jgi:hypothetical protein
MMDDRAIETKSDVVRALTMSELGHVSGGATPLEAFAEGFCRGLYSKNSSDQNACYNGLMEAWYPGQ